MIKKTLTSIKIIVKSEVGMAVLKSKQTRVLGIISTYVYIVHAYTCFFNTSLAVHVSVNRRSIT